MQSPSRDELIGAWELREFVVTYDDGRAPLHPLGDDARGLLMYSESGKMSAVLSRAGRPGLGMARVESTPRVDDAAKAAAFDSYVSYAGRFRVADGRVTHDVELALAPDIVGQENIRSASLSGDTLILRYDVTPPSGNTRHYALTWSRA